MRLINQCKHQIKLPASAQAVFAWHERPYAFQRLIPPWERVTLLEHEGGLEAGNRTRFTVKIGLLSFEWVLENTDCEPPDYFIDMQIEGPLAYWRHIHRFRALSDDTSIFENNVRFLLPGGTLYNAISRRNSQKRIKRIFRYRGRLLSHDLSCLARYTQKQKKIVIAGGSGFIGTHLTHFLSTSGHIPYILTRNPTEPHHIHWDPDNDTLDAQALEGCDAVINLAGENIASEKWTPERKHALLNSRLQSTKLLAKTIDTLQNPPEVFISASAIGYYGTNAPKIHDESHPQGEGFLAHVCGKWEEAARTNACRVVNARFGTVLFPRGGALAHMLPLFYLGLGGAIGGGRQMMSWIVLDDLIYQLYHCLQTPSISGPVNCVAPQTITNKEFTKKLGKHIRRWTPLPLPASAVRLFFGQMGEETLLATNSVAPKALLDSGAEFAYPTLDKALHHIFGR